MNWQLDTRCKTILDILVNSDDYVTVHEIGKMLNISRRSVYYDLNKINDWFSMKGLNEIDVERNKGILLTSAFKKKISEFIKDDDTLYYIISQKERVYMAICSLLGSAEPIFVEQLCLICDISRNTAFNDLKIVRQKLTLYDLNLSFEPHIGYVVEGPTIKKRAVFLYFFEQIIGLIENKYISSINLLPFYNKGEVRKYIEKLKEIETALETAYVDGLLLSLATLIYTIKKKEEEITFEEIDAKEISQTKEFYYVHQIFKDLPNNEQVYITLHLLGSRVQAPTLKFVSIDTEALARKLVLDFERLSCVVFEEKEKLVSLLSYHLSMSVYRYKYGIQIGNPLLGKIQAEYSDLFKITKAACKNLKVSIGMPISDGEIAYIAMHFGGYLRKKDLQKTKYKVLIVCPNGISTANMLRGEVENLNSDIEVVQIVPLKELKEAYENVDLIISTIDVECNIPYLKVNPVISNQDKERILAKVFEKVTSSSTEITLDKVFKIVKEYVDPKNHENLKKDLYNFFRSNNTQLVKRTNKIGLMDVIKSNRVQYLNHVNSWEEAIEIASKPILQEKIIDYNYINAMISNVKKYGPYIVIANKVAFAHAKPEDGVKSVGASILCLDNEINMLGSIVKVIFVLAPVNKISHLGVVKDVMEFFMEESNVDTLLRLKDPSRAMEFISQILLEDSHMVSEI